MTDASTVFFCKFTDHEIFSVIFFDYFCVTHLFTFILLSVLKDTYLLINISQNYETFRLHCKANTISHQNDLRFNFPCCLTQLLLIMPGLGLKLNSKPEIICSPCGIGFQISFSSCYIREFV